MANRLLKEINISEWTAHDIDRFESFISDASKEYEYEHILIDADSLADTVKRKRNKEPERYYGHWKYKGHAIFVQADMLECSVLFERVKLMPVEGRINIIKWEKE